jgi:hypothetical protein
VTNRERILGVLQDTGQPCCDTCLTQLARISTRQVTYMECAALARAGYTERERGICSQCGKSVLCNRLSRRPGFVLPRREPERSAQLWAPTSQQPVAAPVDCERPWYWEGNVQAVAAAWLEAQGWVITQAADTATRAPGVDLVARRLPDKELWVTVKGWPESCPHTQARHWFAGVLFDLVLYRNENSHLYLAAALPDGYATYRNLAERTTWLRRTMPFTLIWVAADGKVRSE